MKYKEIMNTSKFSQHTQNDSIASQALNMDIEKIKSFT